LTNPVIQIIREATAGSEYEGRLYLVGGIVRDRIMGRPPTEDVDIVLEGNALELARFLHQLGVTDHSPVTYPRFGTAMVSIEGNTVELVSARRESYEPVSRKPEVQPANLFDDIMRRDFTINTLLEDLHTGEVLDLTGRGIADIHAGIIRTPTDPATTFYDDPLRMLRAIRFAVRFGYQIEEGTYDAIVRDAPRLAIISKERIRDEFVKILLSDRSSAGLRLLKETGLLAQFAPELMEMHGVTQDGGHIYDVWEHTLHALEALPSYADLALRLAVLFHDIGKPTTKSLDEEGHSHFYRHEDLGAATARRLLGRLRFPKSETTRVARLVQMHMRVGEYTDAWSDTAVRRLMRDAGVDIDDLLALGRADRLGANPNASGAGLHQLHQRMEQLRSAILVAEMCSPLNGREIMEMLRIPPGPKVGEVKDFLCEEIVEGRLKPRDKATARQLMRDRFGGTG
jgi:poly(A) polymerase